MSEKLKALRQQYQENPSTLTSSQRGYLQRLGELSSEESINKDLLKAVTPTQKRAILKQVPPDVRAFLRQQGEGVESAFIQYATKLSTAKNAFAQSLRRDLGIDVDRGHPASLKGDPTNARVRSNNRWAGLTPTTAITTHGSDTEGYAESGRDNRRHGKKNLFAIKVLQQLNVPTNWMESAVNFVKDRPDLKKNKNTKRDNISESLKMNKLGLGKINVDQAEMQSYIEHDLKKSGLFNRKGEEAQLKSLLKNTHNKDLVKSAKDPDTSKAPWDVTKKRRLTKQEMINQRGKITPSNKLIKIPRVNTTNQVPPNHSIVNKPTGNNILKVLPTSGLAKLFSRENRINRVRSGGFRGGFGGDFDYKNPNRSDLPSQKFMPSFNMPGKVQTPDGMVWPLI